jgi:predicted component of type VI protein secretion system
MPAQLVALNEGPNILVDKPILLLGRHPECDIQIDSRKISRRHCCIAQVNDYLVVRDLDSTNGIRINGIRVVEGQLKPGDELTIGNHRYRVQWGEVAHRPPRMAGPGTLEENEDDLLEACDEPVALPDPEQSPQKRSRPVPGTAHSPSLPPPVLPPEEDGFVIPENLELLPNSGSYPGAAGQQGQ